MLSSVTPILDRFTQDLHARGIEGQVALCRELCLSSQLIWEYAAYFFLYFDPLSTQDIARMKKQTLHRYGSIPGGFQKLDILTLDSSTEIRTISLLPEHGDGHALKITAG